MTQRFTDEFAEAVLGVVESIPAGSVMSYGDIAAAIGSRAPRAVGAVMATGGSDAPWWRVVRADGRPAQGLEAEALRRLRAEGAPLSPSGERVAMRLARHRP